MLVSRYNTRISGLCQLPHCTVLVLVITVILIFLTIQHSMGFLWWLMMRFGLSTLRLVDYILGLLGVKLVPINMRSILHGLSPEELEESRDPMIAVPLGLFADCLEKASGKDLDVVARMVFKDIVQSILRKRAGIKRTLDEQPDILNVSDLFDWVIFCTTKCNLFQGYWKVTKTHLCIPTEWVLSYNNIMIWLFYSTDTWNLKHKWRIWTWGLGDCIAWVHALYNGYWLGPFEQER